VAGLLIGCLGVVAALALPFAPVFAERTEVAWPGPGQPAVSTTAFFAPYRPVGLTATLPCPVLRAATEQGHPVAVLATAADGAGLLVRVAGGSAQVFLNGRLAGAVPVGMADCGVTVIADAGGVLVDAAGGAVARLPTEPIPEVREFRTELSAARAAGLTVRAATMDPFALRSTGLKRLLLTVQLLAAAAALVWLARGSLALVRPTRSGRAALAVDAAVLITLAGWAVIGPLSDDDGFAAMIARNSRDAGYQGNYYRWWNASETPFALAQHVLAPLTEVSMGPLWLRMPSTLLAMLTWFALSRGVLPAAVPRLAHRAGLRLLAAGCFLACWLPFNLGVRPEAYLAAGLTCVLALLWRAEGLPSVALATAVAALTVTASPSAVLLAAPVLMFAPKIVRLVRAGTGSAGSGEAGTSEAGAGAGSAGRGEAGAAPRLLVLARVAALCAVGGVALTLVFADQSWHALAVATRWHTTFGPSLPWYDELERYRFLLAGDQDGTATKRVPVLLTLALLPIVGLLLARRAEGRSGSGGRVGPGAARLAGVATLGLALFWLTPSKWSHHFGALAGVFAAFLVVAMVLLVRCARRFALPTPTQHPEPVALPTPTQHQPDRLPLGVGVAGAALMAMVAGLSFSGPNAWWQPVVYDVPWAAGPVRPGGLPLDSPLCWAAALVAGYLLLRWRRGARPAIGALVAAPALLAGSVVAVSVTVLLVSFVAAPVRQPVGSLALTNLRWLARQPTCGLADAVRVIPDVPGGLLSPSPAPGVPSAGLPRPTGARTATGAAGGSTAEGGFLAGAGFDPAAPPPDPPGTGISTYLWGSLSGGPFATGTLTSPWFTLPPVAPDQQVAVSVAGRTDGGNRLALEFGGATDPPDTPSTGTRTTARVQELAEVIPPDPPRAAPGQDPDYRLWRAVGVDAEQIPPGANRVRVRAVDATADPSGWLAVTGPRLRQVRRLTDYLATHPPVLVNWPIAFLFPCVTDRVAVRAGLAQAPAVVLEAPRRYAGLSAATTEPSIGGNFAGLRSLGGLGEEDNELLGLPGVDWGDVLLAHYQGARDAYQLTTSWERVSGLGD